jgi:hypothetical protein
MEAKFVKRYQVFPLMPMHICHVKDSYNFKHIILTLAPSAHTNLELIPGTDETELCPFLARHRGRLHHGSSFALEALETSLPNEASSWNEEVGKGTTYKLISY